MPVFRRLDMLGHPVFELPCNFGGRPDVSNTYYELARELHESGRARSDRYSVDRPCPFRGKEIAGTGAWNGTSRSRISKSKRRIQRRAKQSRQDRGKNSSPGPGKRPADRTGNSRCYPARPEPDRRSRQPRRSSLGACCAPYFIILSKVEGSLRDFSTSSCSCSYSCSDDVVLWMSNVVSVAERAVTCALLSRG